MGALMICISDTHPDLLEFITHKSDLNLTTGANMSVKFSDLFFDSLKNDVDWTMSFYRPETQETIEKTMKASDIMNTLAKTAWDYGEPGILYWDRVNKYCLLGEDPIFKYEATNPCVTGDTPILTDNGYFPIKDLIGKNVNIWNGYQWSEVVPQITGVNQPIRLIEFSDGSFLKCTDYHKFMLEDGSRVEAKNLEIGTVIQHTKFPVIDLIKYDSHGKFFVQNSLYDISSRINVLDTIIDSNGRLCDDKSGSIEIISTDKTFLYDIKLLLNTLGCDGAISSRKETVIDKLKDENKDCHCSEVVYELQIPENFVKVLKQFGLKTNIVPLVTTSTVDSVKSIEIVKNTPIGEEPFVYCFNEPINHSGVFNGIMTAQCGELPLPSGGVCLLGALNLTKIFTKDFFKHTKARQSVEAVRRMEKCVSISVRYLNEVLEESIDLNPLIEQKRAARKYRPIGLGIMGLADVFINAGVKYGSEESIDICHMIGYTLAWNALKTSCELAKELGKFKACKVSYILKSKFIKENIINNPYYDEVEKKSLLDDIKKYGLRNAQLLTIAPTGTTSTILKVSGGIEPMFSTHYKRTTKTVNEDGDKTYEVYPKAVEDYFEEHPEIEHDVNKLPEYFITARYITPKERIDVQAAMQMHIDNAISGTVNLPESTTVEEVKDLYIYAHDVGLKGITVFRENCKRVAILNDMNDKGEEKKDEKEKPAIDIKNMYQVMQQANSKEELKEEKWEKVELIQDIDANKKRFYAWVIEFTDGTEIISKIEEQEISVGTSSDSSSYSVTKTPNKVVSDSFDSFNIHQANDTNEHICTEILPADVIKTDKATINDKTIDKPMVTRNDLGRRLDASVYYVRIGCGHLYIVVSHDENGRPVEVFMNSSKSGGCSANAESLGRYASACLRSNMDINTVIDITRGVKCPACTSLKGKGYEIDGLSCGDAMARVIKEEMERLNKLNEKNVKCNCGDNCKCSNEKTHQQSKPTLTKGTMIINNGKTEINLLGKNDIVWDYREHSYEENISKGICPECGEKLLHSEGCLKCLSCCFSKC